MIKEKSWSEVQYMQKSFPTAQKGSIYIAYFRLTVENAKAIKFTFRYFKKSSHF